MSGRLNEKTLPAALALTVLTLLCAALFFRYADSSQVNGVTVQGEGEFSEDQDLYAAFLELSEVECATDVLHMSHNSVCVDGVLCTQGAGSLDASIEVELHRIEFGLFDSYISTKRMSANGWDMAVWDHVGAGEYYLVFRRADDGRTVWSQTLLIYSVD